MTQTLSSEQLLRLAQEVVPSATYRQIDYAIRKGLIPQQSDLGSGRRRRFWQHEATLVCAYLVLLPLSHGDASVAMDRARKANYAYLNMFPIVDSRFVEITLDMEKIRKVVSYTFTKLERATFTNPLPPGIGDHLPEGSEEAAWRRLRWFRTTCRAALITPADWDVWGHDTGERGIFLCDLYDRTGKLHSEQTLTRISGPTLVVTEQDPLSPSEGKIPILGPNYRHRSFHGPRVYRSLTIDAELVPVEFFPQGQNGIVRVVYCIFKEI